MKNTITHTAEWILVAILGILLCYTSYKSYQIKDKIETVTVTDTIRLSDTIVNLDYDTVYFNRYDTIKLPVIDTVNDTIIKIDSILVQIPINTYVYDTTITDSLYKTSLKAVLSGFNCQMDSLYLNTKIMPLKAKKEPFYKNIVPAVGIGFGTGGQIGLFFGIGYKL